jgi:hypothetical protein
VREFCPFCHFCFEFGDLRVSAPRCRSLKPPRPKYTCLYGSGVATSLEKLAQPPTVTTDINANLIQHFPRSGLHPRTIPGCIRGLLRRCYAFLEAIESLNISRTALLPRTGENIPLYQGSDGAAGNWFLFSHASHAPSVELRSCSKVASPRWELMACVIVPRYHLADSKPPRLLRFWRLLLPGSKNNQPRLHPRMVLRVHTQSCFSAGPCYLSHLCWELEVPRCCQSHHALFGRFSASACTFEIAAPIHQRTTSHRPRTLLRHPEDGQRYSRKLLIVSQATKLRPGYLAVIGWTYGGTSPIPQSLLPNVDTQDSMPARA